MAKAADRISYESAAVPVRDDLVRAHRREWQRLAAPGTWWRGAERVAIAGEVRASRNCPLCRKRKAALSPHAAGEEHEAAGPLCAAAVDVAHRVTTDPARLTKDWYDEILAAGLTPEQYVEIVGTVATVVSIDSFCRGLDVSHHPLPEPEPGEPSRYRPAAARDDGAWVPMIPNGKATGAEADLYAEGPGGRTGNVIRALSLVPDEVRALKDLSAAHYLSPRQMMDLGAGRAISRAQIELIAGRVSALHECFY